ncbi:MAG TPA: TrmH family RNA methyltransferase [Candidatus Paceibacterota bacterium]|nr:TrmH family RNA methyltransferase [Candidatus Paceibacterota bacterium]
MAGINDESVSIIVVLHNIRSLHNVGSIFRTADAAGISKLYLCGVTPSPVDRFGKFIPQFAKVSLGAEAYVPWEKAKSAAAVIAKLKKDGYRIFAIEQAKGAVPYNESRITKNESRVALVFGNEVNGLPQSVLRHADKILEIPMHGRKESLNVSVAFGIVAFALAEKRV